MARYYKKRRYRKSDDGLGGLVGLVVLGGGAYAYTNGKELIDKYPYLPTLAVVVAFSLVSLLVFLAVRRYLHNKHLYDAISLSSVDTMDGLGFERYLADLLKKRGYTGIRLTEKYDFGVDLIAKKDGITWGIQAKRYKSPVKAEAVRQAYTALNRYGCSRAMVITNSRFTRQAQTLASDNNIPLIGREELAEWIYAANRKEHNRGDIL